MTSKPGYLVVFYISCYNNNKKKKKKNKKKETERNTHFLFCFLYSIKSMKQFTKKRNCELLVFNLIYMFDKKMIQKYIIIFH